MKQTVYIPILFLFLSLGVKGQNKKYKQYDICISSEIHKGKINHGKSYCTAWAIIYEYKDGRKDTGTIYGSSRMFIGDEYSQYQKLSDRGKYIIDSLTEDGISMFQNDYLIYEPIYMNYGKKTYKSWDIQGESVKMYYYSVWKNNKSNGFKLIKEIEIN